jgi:ribosomal protein S18 acetylase RimI-like enzyme
MFNRDLVLSPCVPCDPFRDRSSQADAMKALDWRFLAAPEAALLQRAEAERWLSVLHWDTRATLARVEAARHAGGLPGYAVRDAEGTVRGWTFFLLHQGILQIGAFVADSIDATRALIDAILAAPEATNASAAMCFVFSTAPGLIEELTRRGFAVDRYRYLRIELAARPPENIVPARDDASISQSSFAAWSAPAQLEAMAALLRGAYPADAGARPFASRGTPAEWLDYVTQLVTTTACGAFLAEASFVAAGAATGFDAATLITRLSADTAHVAQIAVAPPARQRGLARRLLLASLDAARRTGHRRATLLVSERNQPAGRLYEDVGFEQVAAFVSAVRG